MWRPFALHDDPPKGRCRQPAEGAAVLQFEPDSAPPVAALHARGGIALEVVHVRPELVLQ
jgi:hypothetical protein